MVGAAASRVQRRALVLLLCASCMLTSDALPSSCRVALAPPSARPACCCPSLLVSMTVAVHMQVRIVQGDVQGPDGQSHRRYALCQIVAVETRAPGVYK